MKRKVYHRKKNQKYKVKPPRIQLNFNLDWFIYFSFFLNYHNLKYRIKLFIEYRLHLYRTCKILSIIRGYECFKTIDTMIHVKQSRCTLLNPNYRCLSFSPLWKRGNETRNERKHRHSGNLIKGIHGNESTDNGTWEGRCRSGQLRGAINPVHDSDNLNATSALPPVSFSRPVSFLRATWNVIILLWRYVYAYNGWDKIGALEKRKRKSSFIDEMKRRSRSVGRISLTNNYVRFQNFGKWRKLRFYLFSLSL